MKSRVLPILLSVLMIVTITSCNTSKNVQNSDVNIENNKIETAESAPELDEEKENPQQIVDKEQPTDMRLSKKKNKSYC